MILNNSHKIIAAVLTAALALSPVLVAPISADDGQDAETFADSWRYQDGDIIIDEGLPISEADDVLLLENYNAQMGSSMEEVPEPAGEADGTVPAEGQEPAAELPAQDQYEKQLDETASQVSEEPSAAEDAAQTDLTQPEQSGQEQIPGADALTETAEDSDPLPSDTPQAGEELQTEQTAEVETPAEAPEESSPQLLDEPQTEQTEPEESVEEPAAAEPQATDPQAAEAPAQTDAQLSAQGAGEPVMQAMAASPKKKYWTWSKGKYKRGPGYLKGIDVSVWQGNINWKKVKAAGIDFAIIRCGYGPNKTSKDDSKFAANVKGCKKYGIPYGVYLYSYANSVSKAKDEADHALRLLKKNNCTLQFPVYYDLEDRKVSKASKKTIVKMANAFCEKLRANGYQAGVYANLNWWNNYLGKFSSGDRWVAQWSKKCTYTKSYSIWQCTSSTHVKGISGRVDANLLVIPRSKMDSIMKEGVKTPVTYKFKTIDGKQCAVSSKGAIVKNKYVKIGAYIYGFDKQGVKITDKKYWFGNKSYTFDKKGRAYISKAKATVKTRFYKKAGSGKKGTLKKGKSFYILRTSGKWSQMADGYWIKTEFIKKTAMYPAYRPSVTVKYKAKLKKKTVSRSGPTDKYLKKKTFKKNKTVTVIGTYGSWSKVSTGQWLPSSKLKKK